jgi:dihydrolipoamide dehydrogenase
MDSFLGAADQDLAKEALKLFTKQGLDIKLSVKVGKVTVGKKSVTVEYETKDGAQKAEFDRLIVSVGRVPNTAGLNAEAVGLKIDGRGFIEVDDHCKTSLPGVWAVGDVVRGPMLAHKAMEEGVMVAELMAGQAGHCNFDTIPGSSTPRPKSPGSARPSSSSRPKASSTGRQDPVHGQRPCAGCRHAAGFVKMIADAKTDRILGVHIIGSNASELIGEAVVTMEFAGASEDLARICHAHPTLSEVVHEAALAVDKRPLHF